MGARLPGLQVPLLPSPESDTSFGLIRQALSPHGYRVIVAKTPRLEQSVNRRGAAIALWRDVDCHVMEFPIFLFDSFHRRKTQPSAIGSI